MKLLLSFLLMFTIFFGVQSQTFQLKGIVLEDKNSRALEEASVYIPILNKKIITDKNGLFDFGQLPQSHYQLQIEHVACHTIELNIILLSDTLLTIPLITHSRILKEVKIEEKKLDITGDIKKPQPTVVKLSSKNILDIPALIGEKDPVKALTLLPGIKQPYEGAAGIYVRGGGPEQNLFLLNNTPMYHSSHFFGLISNINNNAITDIKLIKGGFPARYGGRLSSIVDINTKPSNYQNVQIEGGLGILSSNLTVGIPVVKKKAGLMISARRTLLDYAINTYKKYSTSDNGVNFMFYDLNGRYDHHISDRTQFSAFIFTDEDNLEISEGNVITSTDKDVLTQQWANLLYGAEIKHQFNDKLKSSLLFNAANYAFKVDNLHDYEDDKVQFILTSKIKDYNFINNWHFDYSDNLKFLLGGQFTTHNFSPGSVEKNHNEVVEQLKTIPDYDAIDGSVYLETEHKHTNNLSSNIGLRYNLFNVNDIKHHSIEPRVSTKYLINENTSLKASYTRMQQPIMSLSNPGLGLPLDLWVMTTDNIKPMYSQQISLGLDKRLEFWKNNFIFSTELYYKPMKNIITYKDGYSSDNLTGLDPLDEGVIWEEIVSQGNGISYGGELLFTKTAGDFSGWVGYTLSWTKAKHEGINNDKYFPLRYDRRHDLSLVGFYQLTSKWKINFSWVYGTGQAITLPESVYTLPNFDLSNNTSGVGYETLFIQSERNEYRMKAFHKLDIGMQRTAQHKWGESTFEIGVYNAYNRKNPYFYAISSMDDDPSSNQRNIRSYSVFPIIPSLSYTFKIGKRKKQ
ncbi:MAG: TonB-dependent receptor [Cyclobacteriaceae bacterium]|nr:TonB-dependent receptor [Cyclobacteriaceae bacterium]